MCWIGGLTKGCWTRNLLPSLSFHYAPALPACVERLLRPIKYNTKCSTFLWHGTHSWVYYKYQNNDKHALRSQWVALWLLFIFSTAKTPQWLARSSMIWFFWRPPKAQSCWDSRFFSFKGKTICIQQYYFCVNIFLSFPVDRGALCCLAKCVCLSQNQTVWFCSLCIQHRIGQSWDVFQHPWYKYYKQE